VQLKWLPQAQFAGYYVAQAKGFYKEADLDVTIKPGGPDIAPAQVLAAKGADLTVDWMPSALAAREAGVPMVNVAQIFNRSGMMLTCKKASGVTTSKDFKGKTLGVWFGGNEYPFLSWMGTLGLKTGGASPDVKVLKQGFNVDPLLQNQAACISTMIYNEYWQVIDAGVKPADLVTFPYEDQGVATLEDGLYAREPDLKDAAYVAKLGRFVKASLRGWEYALKNQDEAGQDRARRRQLGRLDGGGAEAPARERREADHDRRHAEDGPARPGRVPAHRQGPARRRQRSGDQEGPGRSGLDARGLGQGDGEIGKALGTRIPMRVPLSNSGPCAPGTAPRDEARAGAVLAGLRHARECAALITPAR
jgi:NitT/TauT family transport system substrate-binding protein